MNKQVDNRVVVIAFIFLICVSLLGFTVYSIKLTFETNAQLAEKAAAVGELQKEVARLRSIKEKEEQIDRVMEQANDKIPAEPDEVDIIEFIKSITTGGKLTGITFDKRVNNDIAVLMPFTITVKSTYREMVDILYAIASARRYYSIESIDINTSENGELSYSISLTAYYSTSSV